MRQMYSFHQNRSSMFSSYKTWAKQTEISNNLDKRIPVRCDSSSRIIGLVEKIMIFIFLLSLVTPYLQASTKTWKLTTGGVWTTASNWVEGSAPVTGDDVIINSDQSASITSVPTLTLLSLTIDGTCTLSGSSTILTISSTFTVASGKTLTSSGVGITIPSGSTGTVNGIFTSSSAFSVSGSVIFAPSAYYSGAGTFALASGATLKIGSADGIVTGSTTNGNLRNSSTRTLNVAANYEYNGTANQNTGTGFPTNLTGSLTINNSGHIVAIVDANRTILGKLNLVAGTFSTMPVSTNRLTMSNSSNTGTINRSEGTITGTVQGSYKYNVSYTGASKTTGSELSGSYFNNVTINLTSGETLTLDQNRAPKGDLTISSGTVNLGSYTFNKSSYGGAITVSDGATLVIGGNSTTIPANYGGHVFNGTVEYSGTAQSVSPETYGYLTISGTATIDGDATVNNALTTNTSGNLTIGSSGSITVPEANITGTLTIDPLGKATINNLVNDGTLNLNATGAAENFSLMMDNYSGSGTANVQLYVTGGGAPNYNWHYVAVPVDGLPVTYFTNINKYNLMAYNDSRVVTKEFNGWSWWDGYDGTPGIAGGGGFTTMSYGAGYNFYNSSDATVSFTGMPSLGTTLGSSGIVSLQYSGPTDNSTIFGYNLLGNSLTCSLDWDQVVLTGAVSSTVYYTTGNQWATYLQGVDGTNGGTKDIPPLQGFFVKADAKDASVDFTYSKEHSTQFRYKKSMNVNQVTNSLSLINPKIKLKLNGNNTSDETIVWFNDNATTSFDEKYDGYKLFSSSTSFGQLYSILGGINYVIDGIPLPADSIIVPLGAIIPQAGTYSLVKTAFIAPDGYNVLLIDKGNGNFAVDLKTSDSYSFSSDAGTITDRFILKITSISTGIKVPETSKPDFNIYAFDKKVNIIPMNNQVNGTSGDFKIIDLTGRTVTILNNVKWNEGSLIQVPCNVQEGIYVAELTSGTYRYVKKVYIH